MSAKVKILKTAIFVIFVVSLLVLIFAFKPLVISAAKAQLRRAFPESTVAIEGCVLKPDSLGLTGITIENKKAYTIVVQKAAARFSPLSLIEGAVAEVEIRGIDLDIRAPQKRSIDLLPLIRLSPGKSLFAVGRVRLSGVNARIAAKDLEAKASFSIDLDPSAQTISAFEMRLDSFRGYNLAINAADLSMRQKTENGRLTIREICYNNKLTVTDIGSGVALKKEILLLNGLSAEALGGRISGEAKLKLDKNLDYLVNLSVRGISLDRVTGDLELEKRVQMSGSLNGAVGLRGQAQAIRFLNADLSVAAPGGALIITDAGFLDTIAKGSRQYLDAVTESFKDYHYAEGTARAHKEGEDYVLEVMLDGAQGKRNFKITVGFKQGG